MKKRKSSEEVAIAKIKAFFAKSRVKEFKLEDTDDGPFTLNEGGLFDTEVTSIDEHGIDTNGYGYREFENVDLDDLQYIVRTTLPQLKKIEPEIFKQETIDKVIEEIKRDIAVGDVEALDEMLSFLPIENLIAYLPEKIKLKR